MIPYYYFQYLRIKQAFQLVPIFHHNVMDIVSLACLTAVAPLAFRSPQDPGLRHGPDLVGLGRWLAQEERYEEAAAMLRRAVDLGLPDNLLFRALWEIGLLEKKMERFAEAVAVFEDLAQSPNPYRVAALEELAKHYERRERDLDRALECARRGLAIEETPSLWAREQRLRARAETSKRKSNVKKQRSKVKTGGGLHSSLAHAGKPSSSGR
jgi:tetratricopeptide (TPR) repeat protein